MRHFLSFFFFAEHMWGTVLCWIQIKRPIRLQETKDGRGAVRPVGSPIRPIKMTLTGPFCDLQNSLKIGGSETTEPKDLRGSTPSSFAALLCSGDGNG
jgi:hypothetical protein